ncbi:MAG: ABC transporter ATP-binding protein [Bacteroidota bacterium]
MNIVEIEALSKSYDGKHEALADCSFTLTKGKICAVVGQSGSGKSTLLRLIAGLERPDKGTIKIQGQMVSDDHKIVPPQERNLGMVFQDFALFPHLTVAKNIAFGLKKSTQATVKELLRLIDLPGYEQAYPNELSGGEEQRVALARTLALRPDLLLLDEPFSNLDANLKSQLRQQIQQIVRQIGTSMIFITHDLFDAIDIADELIYLEGGRMLCHCSIEDFFANIEHESIAKTITELKDNAKRILALTN